ncbi:DUF2341 domain-containing protein [Candidatus Bathyarchaeota archaeon]|nr:DUF2341 domain-containing protein [Candidatus Bathyarchaeota archaeon]
MLSISTLLIKTSILPLNLSQPKYREKATQIYYGSQAAVTKGLADASNNLNKRAAASSYQNYTSLDELTGQENLGLDLIDDWQRDVMKNNPAAGVCVNFSIPMFECEWYDPVDRRGYSLARSNVSIALDSMGFEGLEDEVSIEFEAKLLELIESDGRETTFKIQFLKEEGQPVEKMPRNLVSVLTEVNYRLQGHKTYNETSTGAVRNLGNGTFLVTFLSESNNITRNLDILRENITDIPPGSLISHRDVSSYLGNGWKHVTAVRDTNSLFLYLNGAPADTEDITGYGSISNDQSLYAGGGSSGSDLRMDEIRFCKSTKSSDWISTVYNSIMNDLVTVGERETINQNGWQYKRTLTIDSDLVDSSLSGFPVLVRLSSSNFDYSLANTTGMDIRFNQSGTELPYEIEKWDPGGVSLIWVRVSSISSETDTTLDMYYGNPIALDEQNSVALWSGFNIVHHLEETTGTAYDSTGSANHGTYTGDQLNDPGLIDGGCGFYSDENMEISNHLSIDPEGGEFTFSLWVDLDTQQNTTLLTKWNSQESKGYRLYIDSSGNLVFRIDDNDDNATKNNLLDIVDEVETMYYSGERVSAYNRLQELSERLNPDSPSTVIEGDLETGGILYLIDRILDQLRPVVRVVARDQRGITVSTYGELTGTTEDGYGPIITNQKIQPIQCEYDETIMLEAIADDRWYGNSTIQEAEYFISESMPQGQSGNGTSLNPSDGIFDSSLEGIEASFSSNDLSLGENNIWIHAKDSEGNWGYFKMLQVTLISSNDIHLEFVSIVGDYNIRYFGLIREYWARATVLAEDGGGNPLEDVTVSGYWSGDVSGNDVKITGPDGLGQFRSDSIFVWYWQVPSNGYTFTFTADSASKTGYTWDGTPVTDTLQYP